MTYDVDAGRADIVAFESEQPDNYWRADPHFRRALEHLAGAEAVGAWRDDLDRFGAACAGPVDAAVRLNNLNENLPRLTRYSGAGERIEEVEHHPAYHEAGRQIYGSGVMTALAEPGNNLLSLSLFYLSAQNGEAGHNCPLACTAGLIKALAAVGGDELKERYLPRLLSTDYDRLAHGAQFLTEVQGGSDVGANALRAGEAKDGTWRLTGEKWFCSNVTADLALVTARPDNAPAGTSGLGLFLMPRRLPDGSLNGFSIRRLKDKLGTRTMATAEVDFAGAVAWRLGPLESGFKNMMTYVINTSRIFNAVACAGAARRACLVAHGFARRRKAFGPAIIEFPMTRATLADMRCETAALVSGTFYLISLLDRSERGEASAEELDFLSVAVNLNKMRTALSSHDIINLGIEVLAGNGTIETFSVLPRLLRDNVVYENWEGAHNVLLAQVLRDCTRKRIHRGFFSHLAALARGHARLEEHVAELDGDFAELLEDPPEIASLRMRDAGSRMMYLTWASAALRDGTAAEIVEHFLDRRVGPAAKRDAAHLARLEEITREP